MSESTSPDLHHVTEWQVSRAAATAAGGMVAAKHPAAAEAGAAVLRNGGNAVDAIVAAAFATGVAEPWMSGIGGGGYMVIKGPWTNASVVSFPMIAPRGASPDMFPLTSGAGDPGLFGWPAVVDNANLHGPRSAAVPGVVAGLSLALSRFGTRPLADLIAPALRLAADGVPVTWHTTLIQAKDLATMRRYPETARIFLDRSGYPLVTIEQTSPAIMRQPDLAATLDAIATHGPRAFYEGPIAEAIVNHLSDAGAPWSLKDLTHYEATISDPLAIEYNGQWLHTVGGATGGTTLVESLLLLDELNVRALDPSSPEAIHRTAQAFRQAFADRFAWLADAEYIDAPLAVLADRAYAAERAASFAPDRLGPVRAGDARRMGISHGLGVSVPDYGPSSTNQMADGSTTHLCAIDRDGLSVSLTQTLLSVWGSRVTIPGTGILLNNGMMWFDPEPGRPNSVAGGKRPLSNMAPALLSGEDGAVTVAFGSSGGRKIMNCHAQLVQHIVDASMGIQEALEAPRIDASTADLILSSRLPQSTIAALAAMGHRVSPRDERLLTGDFASPVAISRTPSGLLTGAADPWYFPACAVGVD